MTALVDVDGMLYLAGFAVEKSEYWVVYEDAQGDMHEEYLTDGEKLKALKKTEGVTIVDQERRPVVGPVEHALAIIKDKMQAMKALPGADSLEVYIKGDGGTHRFETATIAPYKGNRDNLHKPTHWDAMVDYLTGVWGAIRVNGREVDDEVSIRAHQLGYKAWVCSPDKDLDQIMGRHWNYRTNVAYEVDADEARRWFFRQVLSGDASDNVKGCWKVGEAKADEWIAEHGHRPSADLWGMIVDLYDLSRELPGCPYADRDPEEVALENARLVYMQKKPGQIWTPPGQPFVYEELNLDD